MRIVFLVRIAKIIALNASPTIICSSIHAFRVVLLELSFRLWAKPVLIAINFARHAPTAPIALLVISTIFFSTGSAIKAALPFLSSIMSINHNA